MSKLIKNTTSLLSLLLFAGFLSAQGNAGLEQGSVDDKRIPGNAQNPSGEAGVQAPKTQDLHNMGLHGVHVEVMQDPIRIAPGEAGHLVLLVRLPRGRTVEKVGQVVMQNKQGPLILGNPLWEPPPKGKNEYSDIIVIKVPLSIDANAAFGKPLFQGKIRLRGDFHAVAPAGDAPEVAADGGQDDPAAPPPGQRPGFDPNRAELPFQRLIHIGPPMLKAKRSHKTSGTTDAGAPKTGAGTEGNSGKAAKPNAGSGQGAEEVAVGKPEMGTVKDPALGPDGPEEAPDLASQDSGGFPWTILSLALGALALLTFVLQTKKA